MTIKARRHQLTLLPERAVLCDSHLIIADTHFGKSATLRAHGIPVPEGDTVRDGARILALVERHQPARLIIAGDFFHAPEGKSPAVLESLTALFRELSCEVSLVLGNHDLRSGSLPAEWPVAIDVNCALGDLTVVHDPADAPTGSFCICGHLHPVARINDGKNTGFRAPCFWFSDNRLVLPSFGTFTGGVVVHPRGADRIFAPLHDQVVEVPVDLC